MILETESTANLAVQPSIQPFSHSLCSAPSSRLPLIWADRSCSSSRAAIQQRVVSEAASQTAGEGEGEGGELKGKGGTARHFKEARRGRMTIPMEGEVRET